MQPHGSIFREKMSPLLDRMIWNGAHSMGLASSGGTSGIGSSIFPRNRFIADLFYVDPSPTTGDFQCHKRTSPKVESCQAYCMGLESSWKELASGRSFRGRSTT